MRMLTKTEILAAEDHQIEAVACPEWGKDAGVYVRTMSARRLDRAEQEISKEDTGRAGYVAHCICDEGGTYLDWTPSEVEALGEKAGHVLDRIVEATLRLNGRRQEDIQKLEKKS